MSMCSDRVGRLVIIGVVVVGGNDEILDGIFVRWQYANYCAHFIFMCACLWMRVIYSAFFVSLMIYIDVVESFDDVGFNAHNVDVLLILNVYNVDGWCW